MINQLYTNFERSPINLKFMPPEIHHNRIHYLHTYAMRSLDMYKPEFGAEEGQTWCT